MKIGISHLQTIKGIEIENTTDIHKSEKLICPLKECTYESKQLVELREHWNKMHSSFRFPEIKSGSGFTYKTNSNNTNQDDVRQFVGVSRNYCLIFLFEIFVILQIVQQQDLMDKSDDSLLIPMNASEVTGSSSSDDASQEDDTSLRCNECNRSFQNVIGFKKHAMVKHNIHSFRMKRKVNIRISFLLLGGYFQQ